MITMSASQFPYIQRPELCHRYELRGRFQPGGHDVPGSPDRFARQLQMPDTGLSALGCQACSMQRRSIICCQGIRFTRPEPREKHTEISVWRIPRRTWHAYQRSGHNRLLGRGMHRMLPQTQGSGFPALLPVPAGPLLVMSHESVLYCIRRMLRSAGQRYVCS